MNHLRRFAFILAEKLGRTVEELLESISSRELSEWMVHFGTHTSESWVQTGCVIQATLAPHVKSIPPLTKLVPKLAHQDDTPMSPAQMKANLALALG